jgi:hypothetical protein
MRGDLLVDTERVVDLDHHVAGDSVPLIADAFDQRE